MTRGRFTVAVFLDGGRDCAKNNTKDCILGERGKWRQSMFLSEYIKKAVSPDALLILWQWTCSNI